MRERERIRSLQQWWSTNLAQNPGGGWPSRNKHSYLATWLLMYRDYESAELHYSLYALVDTKPPTSADSDDAVIHVKRQLRPSHEWIETNPNKHIKKKARFKRKESCWLQQPTTTEAFTFLTCTYTTRLCTFLERANMRNLIGPTRRVDKPVESIAISCYFRNIKSSTKYTKYTEKWAK